MKLLKHSLILLLSIVTLISCNKDDDTSPNNGDVAFVTKWQTTTDNENITIRTNSDVTGYNYNIDWGDGSTDSNLTGDATHTYVAAGTHTVSISRDFPAIQIYPGFGASQTEIENTAKLISIENWGTIEWKTMASAFRSCVNLEYNATNIPDLSNVTDMQSMFEGCVIFDGNIGSWDVSSIENMNQVFRKCTNFNQDISNWDVSNVTTMGFMFAETDKFNQDIGNWDISSVTNMPSMFGLAMAFNQDISNWNVSNVINMQSVFFKNGAFNQDISNWDVSKVTSMGAMFTEASVFNQNIGNWDVSSVTNMQSMFSFNNIFNQNLSNWDVNNVIHCDGFTSTSSALTPENIPNFTNCTQ